MMGSRDRAARHDPETGFRDGRRGGISAASAVLLPVILAFAVPSPAAAQEEPVSGGNPCLQCHEGIAAQQGTWNGRRFTHTPHLERANLDCTFCHTPLEQHGGMRFESVAACNDCHHARTSGTSCSRCHRAGEEGPEGVIAHEIGDFEHRRHTLSGVSCTTCHSGATMSAASIECTACHAVHHRPESTCLACHRAGSVPEHPTQVHVDGCAACHGENGQWIDRWTRETCSVCHVGRVEHYPDRPCTVCHIVPPFPATSGN